MKVEAYQSRSFNAGVGPLVVRRHAGQVGYLVWRPYAVDLVTTSAAQFDRDYLPIQVSQRRLDAVLDGLRQAALTKGMTVRAAAVLPKLVPMTKEQIEMATENGSAAEGKILEDAAKEHAKDGAPSGKAPRKLAGAALAAANRKKEREAAERQGKPVAETPKPAPKRAAAKPASAKGRVKSAEAQTTERLAAEVTADLQHAEAGNTKRADAKATDLTLTKTGSAKVQKTKGAKDKVQAEAARRQPAAKAAKGDGQFDPASLKHADGRWKSASAMMKGLIWEGKHKGDDHKLFKLVQKEFDLADDKVGYVAWNRGWFKRNGIELPA